METILKAEGISKIYKQGENSIYAVKNCSLAIEKGTFNVVVGASGSGKSTLLHILSGMDRPSSGTVFIGDEEIYKLSENRLSRLRNRSIGFVFQKFYLLPFLTAYENILLPKSLPGNTVSEGFVSDVIHHLMLEDRLDHLPHELSGGQQQRVAIARALINQPKVIFADEPTGNLDKNTSTEVIGYLRECAKLFEQTVFLVTHDQNIIGDRDIVYYMDDGYLSQILK